MTDNAVTDVDLRNARLWAEKVCPPSVSPGYIGTPSEIHSAARVILATVDPPAPTLAEELARIAENSPVWTIQNVCDELKSAADRAEQMEHDLAESRAEVERLTAVNENLRRTDNYREFKEFLGVQKGAESNAESIDPADVRPGEPWLIRVRGRDAVAIRDGHEEWPWSVAFIHGEPDEAKDDVVTLVSRLVPAPRVITNADDLGQLAEGAIIRSRDGEACRKSDGGDWSVDGLDGSVGYGPRQVLPVTVLWEPGA